MSDALQRLIEAVEAGTADDMWSLLPDGLKRHHVCIVDAYYDDLNAAKTLHDALLPGWRMRVSQSEIIGDPPLFTACVWPTDATRMESVFHPAGRHGYPARAWLLAILRAYQQVQQ